GNVLDRARLVDPVEEEPCRALSGELGPGLRQERASVVVAAIRAPLGDRRRQPLVALRLALAPCHLRHHAVGAGVGEVGDRGAQPVGAGCDQQVLEGGAEGDHHAPPIRVGDRQGSVRAGCGWATKRIDAPSTSKVHGCVFQSLGARIAAPISARAVSTWLDGDSAGVAEGWGRGWAGPFLAAAVRAPTAARTAAPAITV